MIAATQFSLPSIGYLQSRDSGHQDIRILEDRTTDEFGRLDTSECRPKTQIERDR